MAPRAAHCASGWARLCCSNKTSHRDHSGLIRCWFLSHTAEAQGRLCILFNFVNSCDTIWNIWPVGSYCQGEREMGEVWPLQVASVWMCRRYMTSETKNTYYSALCRKFANPDIENQLASDVSSFSSFKLTSVTLYAKRCFKCSANIRSSAPRITP